ncbi:MAG: glutamine amidotransferase [Verrucomicrobiota bacterium]
MIPELITRPHFLWLLCLVPLLGLALRQSLAGMPPARRRVCLGVRAGILALLVLALAGLRVPWRSHEVAAVFAFDRSASITPEAERAGREFVANAIRSRGMGDDAVVLGFARDVMTIPAATSRAWPAQPDRDGTDISKALAFSAAVFPEGKVRRLVLLSDGNDTAGHAQEAARALSASGVELVTVPLRNPLTPEVLVERLEIPPALKENEPFDATAVVRSNVETGCTVRLFADGFEVGEPQRIQLKSGVKAVPFRNLRSEKGESVYRVEISPEQDTVLENNRATAMVSRRGMPKVLVADPAPEKLQPLIGKLREAHIDATAVSAAGLPKTLDALQGCDALLLSDLPSSALSPEQMQLYSQWVRDFGGGFAMIGGENSFGVGGYYRTPIETMLPVSTEHDDRTEAPTVAVMIVLDCSGSMNAQEAGQSKISLASQGAALALDVLQPKDLLGVMAVDTRIHQIVPLARHENKAEVSGQILRITAGGGGIYVYSSLLDAYSQLRDANAKIKHVILFSDAADAEEQAAGERPDGSHVPGNAVDLVSQMAGARISTSIVALGNDSDKDVLFLKQLATSGGGRFYLTGDALTLPQIFTTETMRVAQSSLMEEPVLALPVKEKAPALDGIDFEKSPPLGGYNVTKLKKTADLLLATEKGDPILATWRYGLGQAGAFTSDAKSRWAGEWLTWPGYGKFWTQFVRSLLRKNSGTGLQVQSSLENGELRLEIDAESPDGTFRNQLPIQVHAVEPGGATHDTPARQVAPGRYSAGVAISGTGTTWVSVRTGELSDGGTVFACTQPYPAEFVHNATDEPALRQLAQIAGGSFAPEPEAVFAQPALGTRRFSDLSSLFLSLALLLLPVDVWLRRSPSQSSLGRCPRLV